MTFEYSFGPSGIAEPRWVYRKNCVIRDMTLVMARGAARNAKGTGDPDALLALREESRRGGVDRQAEAAQGWWASTLRPNASTSTYRYPRDAV